MNIQNVLGVIIPESVVSNEIYSVTHLNADVIRGLLPEKEPQVYVSQAILFSNGNSFSDSTVYGVIPISERMCKGHFDWMPTIPLAIASQACAQVCSLLPLFFSDNHELIPLVVQVDQIKSIMSKEARYAEPGDKLLAIGQYLKGRGCYHKVKCDLYLEQCKIATLSEISFVMASKLEILKKRRRDNGEYLG